MPQETAETSTQTQTEAGRQFATDLLKLQLLLAERILKLTAVVEKLEKSVDERLLSKLEDLTSALDDHRGVLHENTESSGAVANVLDVFLTMIEEAGALEHESDTPVTWEDLSTVLRKIAKDVANESENEDDEDDDDDDSSDQSQEEERRA